VRMVADQPVEGPPGHISPESPQNDHVIACRRAGSIQRGNLEQVGRAHEIQHARGESWLTISNRTYRIPYRGNGGKFR